MPRAWHALGAYTLIAVAATWPLAAGLGRDVAWDLGDSILNMWILAWDCEQMLAILGGDVSRIGSFFDGNIFHPATLTLAYSEHLVPQAVQILPVYALTRNPILAYNLLFLSTFVLSGLGTYLFVRELTGSPRAAFVAGLLFAFAPYRVPQFSHLQVLSSQWMPFALYGFRRYFDALTDGRPVRRPLLGAAAALVAQNLSCGYYLLYFSPFAGAYALWEIWRRGLWRNGRMWAHLSGAAVLVLALTLPFLLPYAVVREELQLGRALGEVVRFSADIYSYGTAFADQPLWGDAARAFPKPEGELFTGLVPVLLAFAGLVWWRGKDVAERAPLGRPRIVTLVLLAAIAVHVAAVGAALLYRRVVMDLGLFDVSIRNATQLLVRIAVLTAVLLALSPAARRNAGVFMRTRGFFLVALVTAMWLSLGPLPQTLGRPLELFGLYSLFYDYVPGFDGVRVPARFAMIVSLMLAVLGGLGAAVIARRRYGTPVLAALALLFLAESVVLPFTVNGADGTRGLNAPEPRLYRPARAPAIYHDIAREADTLVLAELPLGDSDYDLRAMFYSTVHWRPVLNGYSGFFPPGYGQLALAVSDVPRHPAIAWEALRAAGATHVLVHEAAWPGEQGRNTSAALRQLGAVERVRHGSDVLLSLP